MKTLQVKTKNLMVIVRLSGNEEEDDLTPAMARRALFVSGYSAGQVWELGEILPRRGYRVNSSGVAKRLPDREGWD